MDTMHKVPKKSRTFFKVLEEEHQTGSFTNKEIASHFGIGNSAVSRRVSCCNMIESNKDFKEGYKLVKSLIKI
jgi:hypothetical protein